MKERTLVFLCKPEKRHVLLAMKKRGFGEGKWNGVGGKLEGDETLQEAAIREAEEEIGVVIEPGALSQVATIDFFFKDKEDFNQRVHVFFVERWTGEPLESEEMRPQWYSADALPYEEMWVDDKHWLPLVLAGKKIAGSFTFTTAGDAVLEMNIEEK